MAPGAGGPLTTHVLDTSSGKPAAGMRVALFRHDAGEDRPLRQCVCGPDGRTERLVPSDRVDKGVYRLRFYTEEYFDARGVACFYPWCEILFHIRDPGEHHHVPLIVSPHGYSTYRGS